MKSMQALVKKESKEVLWLEEIPIPEVGGNDVLVKIEKTAICGTDVHIYHWDDWARIRTQISAAHTREDLDTAIEAFSQIYAELR